MLETNDLNRTPQTRLLVIQPDAKCDLDRLGRWLDTDGIVVQIIRPFEGGAVPDSVDGDGLIVLGGSMGALDEAEYPYLAAIKALLRKAVDEGIPTLGICLGAQLLAAALGGEVRRGDAGLESGIVSVRWLDAAQRDRLVGGLEDPFAAPALHFDAVTRLPQEAVLLGTGDTYPNQVFRVGSAWGVQFHPEITPARFRSWGAEVPESGRTAHDRDASELDSVDGLISSGARRLAHRFVRIVREGSQPEAS